MNKPNYINCDFQNGKAKVKVNVKPQEGCILWSRGRNALMADAAEAQVIIRIGRTVLINVPKMNSYYEALAGK